jgi:hypothetical protein
MHSLEFHPSQVHSIQRLESYLGKDFSVNIGHKFLAVTEVTVKPEIQNVKKNGSDCSRPDRRPYYRERRPAGLRQLADRQLHSNRRWGGGESGREEEGLFEVGKALACLPSLFSSLD